MTVAFQQCAPVKLMAYAPPARAEISPALTDDQVPVLAPNRERSPSMVDFLEDTEALEAARSECPDNGAKNCFYICHISADHFEPPRSIIVAEESLLSHLSDHEINEPSEDYLGACRETED